MPGSIDNVRFFAGAARDLDGMAQAEYDGDHTSSIRREPIGVVGLDRAVELPAADGRLEDPPRHRRRQHHRPQAGRDHAADLPDVRRGLHWPRASRPAWSTSSPAPGAVVGEALLSHPDVAMVSFTGSTPVGRASWSWPPATVKRVHLELGGKAPFVVFDDADLEAAVHGAVAGALINTGQDCTAATRAFVQRPLYDAFVEAWPT